MLILLITRSLEPSLKFDLTKSAPTAMPMFLLTYVAHVLNRSGVDVVPLRVRDLSY